MMELRIFSRNLSEIGGTYLSIGYTFARKVFDAFDFGEPASPGLERLAEDKDGGLLSTERAAISPGGQSIYARGEKGVFLAPQEIDTYYFSRLAEQNTHVTVLGKILPSNDAFIGTETAMRLLDDEGQFEGAVTLNFAGADVLDAGTEINSEYSAFFINQRFHNTGPAQHGVIGTHPGFKGSYRNSDFTGNQVILGGRNDTLGVQFDPIAADFTRPGAMVATAHVNTMVRTTGGDDRDILRGTDADDLAKGGADRDFFFGGDGFDELSGQAGRDVLLGGDGQDLLYGGAERDILIGGTGRDVLTGGKGNDRLNGGEGTDSFHFSAGDDRDRIDDFDSTTETITFSGIGYSRFSELAVASRDLGAGTRIDYSGSDFVYLRGVALVELGESNFVFV